MIEVRCVISTPSGRPFAWGWAWEKGLPPKGDEA